MIELTVDAGPLRLKNPVIAGSCEMTMTEDGIRTCLNAGAGAVVVKSVNESPAAARQLGIAEYALLDGDGECVAWPDRHGDETLLCRSGLAQHQLDDWCNILNRVRRYAHRLDAALIGSITVAELEPAAHIAAQLAEVTDAIELNVGAPHGREAHAVQQITSAQRVAEYTRTLRATTDTPLIVKLPAQTDDPVALADAAKTGGADAVTLLGRFNGFWPDTHTGEPVLRSWGAVGDRGMLPVALYWISKTYIADPTFPLIGTNGARSGADAARFLLSGARATELATALLTRGPTILGKCITELEHVLYELGHHNATDAIGWSAKRARPYAAIPPRTTPFLPWSQ